MGLDGISINQLRSVVERNSNELNSNVNFSLNPEIRSVDGLSSGQRVDPDKQKEQEKQKKNKSFNKDNNETFEEEIDDTHAHFESIGNEIVKYDLSKSELYSLELDSESDEILIVDKHTKNIVQRISAGELSRFVNFLPNAQGTLVNRKF